MTSVCAVSVSLVMAFVFVCRGCCRLPSNQSFGGMGVLVLVWLLVFGRLGDEGLCGRVSGVLLVTGVVGLGWSVSGLGWCLEVAGPWLFWVVEDTSAAVGFGGWPCRKGFGIEGGVL